MSKKHWTMMRDEDCFKEKEGNFEFNAKNVQIGYMKSHFNVDLGAHVDGYSDLKKKMKVEGLGFEDNHFYGRHRSDHLEKSRAAIEDKKRRTRYKGTAFSYRKAQ